MKTPLIVIGALLCTPIGRCDVLFQGYMTSSSGPKFVISIDQQRTSGWLAIGQEFGGYSIASFDTKAEALKVAKDGTIQELHLTEAKVIAAVSKPTPPAANHITISVGADEVISLGDETTIISALKSRFSAAAAMSPQPVVAIRAQGDVSFDRLRAILDLCRTAGLKRIDVTSPPPASKQR